MRGSIVMDSIPGVLVVNHQPDLRALLQTILRHYGFRVFLSPSGPEALALYRQNRERIRLVLIGASMPERGAQRTLTELQKIQRDVLVCCVSGERRTHADLDLVALGAARVIHMPFEPSELAKTLWRLMGTGDRRADKRRVRQLTRVKVGAGLEPEHVVESWIGDQSADGLRLRLPEKLGDVGALLSIRSVDAGDDIPWIPVQIRHVRPESGMWTVGCQFVHPATQMLV
jgi:CheY-like chemotaxis protein